MSRVCGRSCAGTASRSARVTSTFTPDPAKEKRGFNTQFSRSCGGRSMSDRKNASGTAGCLSSGRQCLDQRKYQLGCPAQETSSGSVRSNRKFRPLGLELVEDQPVVDPQDPRRLSIAAIPQLPSALLDLARVDRAHAPEFPGEDEIDRGLLVRRIQIEKDDVLRRVAGENDVADRFLVGGRRRARRDTSRGLRRPA